MLIGGGLDLDLAKRLDLEFTNGLVFFRRRGVRVAVVVLSNALLYSNVELDRSTT